MALFMAWNWALFLLGVGGLWAGRARQRVIGRFAALGALESAQGELCSHNRR